MRKHNSYFLNLSNIVNVFIVFCYIFAFYVFPPITSSMFVGLLLLIRKFIRTKGNKMILEYRQFCYISIIYKYQLFLIFLSIFYAIIHATYDYSYLKTLVGQNIHFICGIFVVDYIQHKGVIHPKAVEKLIIYAFFIQSIIQIVASVSPSLAHFLLYFNHADKLQSGYGGGVRGLALSTGVGWNLALTYGLVYIIFVKRYLINQISIRNIFIGVILFVGTFFAGRTGFVGAIIGLILFLLNPTRTCWDKVRIMVNVFFVVVCFCLLFYFLFPTIVEHLIEKVFPFAFEPFYAYYYRGEFSTNSTDILADMWKVPISFNEFLFGNGYFIDPITGSYYQKIDIGVLRNLFFWGIGGYLVLICYQFTLFSPIPYRSHSFINIKYYKILMIVYLCIMELKAMTLGFNQMTFSVVFLLSYFYISKTFKKDGKCDYSSI